MEVISRDFEYNVKFKCLKPILEREAYYVILMNISDEIWEEKFE